MTIIGIGSDDARVDYAASYSRIGPEGDPLREGVRALLIGDGEDAISIEGTPESLVSLHALIGEVLAGEPALINDRDDDDDEWCCDAAMNAGTVGEAHDTWCLAEYVDGRTDG